MGNTEGLLLLVLSISSAFAVLLALASTARAFMHARACSSHAQEARERAISQWMGAAVVVVGLTVLRARLNVPEGAAEYRDRVSVPWRAIVLGGAGVLSAAGFLVAVVTALRAQRRRRRKSQRAHAAVQSRVQAVSTRHDAVLEEYGALLVDLLAVLEFPALFDTSFAQTERFERARIDADDARIALQVGGADEHLERYHQAVTELELAWHGAQDSARHIGTSHLEPGVAGRLTKAANLVAAVRGGANDHEKALAYERTQTIRRLVGPTVRIPQQADLALEHLARPALGSSATTARQ